MLYLNKTQTDKVVKVTLQLTCIISVLHLSYVCPCCHIFFNVSDDRLCGKHHYCEYCYLQAKEKLTSQTEEWINMINRQVEEEIGFYEQQAELVSNVVTGPCGAQFREVNHASNFKIVWAQSGRLIVKL